MMRLALLQLRTDFRQFRLLLLGLGVLLLLDLAKCQGWLGETRWEFPFDSRNLHFMGFNWMTGAIVGGCLVMTFGTMLWSSPVRENAFLRTRPMPLSSLWLGKGLFLTAFVLLPVVAIEAANMCLHGCDLSLVTAATWERLTVVLPVLVVVAAISGTAETQKTPVVALLLAYAAGVTGIGTIAIAHHTGTWASMVPDVDATVIRCAMFVMAAFALGFAYWTLRWRVGAVKRWTVFCLLVIAGEWYAMFAPMNLETPGLAQAEVSAAAAKAVERLPLNRLGLMQEESDAGTRRLGWSLAPTFDDLPAGWILRWQQCAAELETADGGRFHGDAYPGSPVAFSRYYNLAEEDIRGLLGLLPDGAILESQSGNGSRGTMNYHPFHLPVNGDWKNGRAKLSIHGRAKVYQWKRVADLNLNPGVSAKEGFTRWWISAAEVKPKLDQIQIVFEQEGPGLSMAADQRLRPEDRWPANRFEFLIYDPVNKLARAIDYRSANSGVVGAHTGYQRRTAILNFQVGGLRQHGWTLHPEQLRLLVFRLDYLGHFEKTIATTFKPGRHLPRYGEDYRDVDRISREDYLRRLGELEAPPAAAPRTVVGNYVHSVLKLIEAHGRVNDGDPGLRALAGLASKFPEVFLDGYGVADSRSHRALHDALKQGLRPDQKSLVIERLEENPDLASLLNDRGWHEDAREELLALLDHHSALPHSALKALASFDDARADERLLREVRENYGQTAYDIAARLPRLAARLDTIIEERWRNHLRHFRAHSVSDSDLALAIRHGKPEALKELIRVAGLRHPERGGNDHSTLIILGNMLEIPGVDKRSRYNTEKVEAALLAVRDREFRFDSVFKQFRLAEGSTSNH